MTSKDLIWVEDRKLRARIGRSWLNSKHVDGITQTKLFKMEHLSDEEEKSYQFPWYISYAIRVTIIETGKVYIAALGRGMGGEATWDLYQLKRDANG